MAWERASGAPIGPAVTWQCRRSADLCERLRADGRAPEITALTGLPVDPMFTAGKLRWLLDASPDGQARAAAGELCVGTVDSWLLWNLTGGARHGTDVSNASRTQLMDIEAGAWDAGLSEAFGSLTIAEKEVTFLLLKGLGFKEIATVRNTSERTARAQSIAIYAKAGLSGRSELAAFFLEDLLLPQEAELAGEA